MSPKMEDTLKSALTSWRKQFNDRDWKLLSKVIFDLLVSMQLPVTVEQSTSDAGSANPINIITGSTSIYENETTFQGDVVAQRNEKTSTNLAKKVQLFVPSFSGGQNGSTMFEVEKFIKAAEHMIEGANHDDISDLFLLLSNKLHGEAYEKIFLHQVKNFAEMKTVLLRYYGQKKTCMELQNDLLYCVQSKDETNENYLMRCEMRYRLAYIAIKKKYPAYYSDVLISELNDIAKHTLKTGTTSTKLCSFTLAMQKLPIERFFIAIEEFLKDERYRQEFRKNYATDKYEENEN